MKVKLLDMKEPPKAYKVRKEHVSFLLEQIKKNKTITIEDLLYLLENKFPDLHLNKSHIHRIINDNNITLKITSYKIGVLNEKRCKEKVPF